jgi:molybdate transport system regulatory protein
MAKRIQRRSQGALSKAAAPILRGRVWIDLPSGAAITEAGADLLEQIDASGSLSEAARRLRFSYRRAWMLLDAMNRRWPGALVTTAVGGKRGGGAKLTPRGMAVLSAYRDLQVQLETLLDHASEGFRRSVDTRGD